MKVIAPFLLFAIYLFPARAQQANTPRYHIRQFTDVNGLPQNSINGLGFDNLGFIWIATQGGIVRFDGQRLDTYHKNQLAVNSDRFIGLKKHALTGDLYAVTEHGQLALIREGKAMPQTRYPTQNRIDMTVIQSLIAAETNDITKVDTLKPGEFPHYRIIADLPGQYYIYMDRQVVFFKAGKKTGSLPFPGEPYFKPISTEPHLRKKVILETKGNICADNFMTIGNQLFYHQGSEGYLLQKLGTAGTKLVALKGDIEQNPDYQTGKDHIRIVTNRFQGQAFAYLSGSIYLITYDPKRPGLHTRQLVQGFDIDKKLVYRMLYDEANGTLLLGSFSNGLSIVRPKPFRIVLNTLQENYHNVFYAHLPFSDSSVIIPDGDILGGHKRNASDGLMFRKGQPTERWGMLKDREGDFWIAKMEKLYHLNATGSAEKASWTMPEIPKCFYQSRSGDVWVGLRNGQIAKFWRDMRSNDTPQFPIRLDGECTVILESKKGGLWLGTSKGLNWYDVQKNRAYPVKGLAKKSIRSIHEGKDGDVWVTTYGDGFYLISGNRLIKMQSDERGYLDHAHCIMEDDQQNFWMPTNKGLFRASRADLLAYARGGMKHVFFLYYNHEEGLTSNEFNGGCQPCGVKLANGYYSLPSMSGLVWFKPGQIPEPDLNAPVRFENLKIDDEPAPLRDTLQLAYDFTHISFDVRSAFTGLADNLDICYIISRNGVDGRWTRVGPEQVVNVYRLNPGNYVLTVRKTTGFGGRYIEKRMVLAVDTPWFLQWWFAATVTIALGLLSWLVTIWRVKSLSRQNLLLTRKVEERTADLSSALNDLKASDEALQLQLQIQMRIIGVINHDLHSPLRYLNKHVPEFIDQVTPYLPDPDIVRFGSSISKSTTKVYRLADDLLKFIKATYNKKGKIVYEQVNILDILNRKALFFAEIARENLTTIDVQATPGLTVHSNQVMIEIMVHNLLDNAVKHTFQQSVTLASGQDAHGHTTITVRDTGFGMYPETVDWLNDRKPARNGTAADNQVPTNLGLGLVIVKEIASLLGIRIVAESDDTGTGISLICNQ